MARAKGKFDWLNLRTALMYFRRLWPFLKPQWPQLSLALVGTVMYSGGYAMRLLAVRPFLKLMGDLQAKQAGIENLAVEALKDSLPYAGILFGGALLMSVGTYLRQYYMGYVQSYTVINLQRKMVDHVLTQPMAFFNTERKGALMSRMTSNTSAASKLVKIVIEGVLSHPVTMVAVLGVLLYTSPILSLATFVVFPVVLVPVMLFAGKIRHATRSKYKKTEAASNFFHQMLDGIRVVKSYRLEGEQREEFERVSEEVFRRARKVARYKGSSRFAVEFTYNTLMALGLLLVGFFVTTTWFSESGGMATFAQFFLGLVFLYDPARKLGHSINDVQESTAALDRAFELLDRKPEIVDRAGAKEAPAAFEEIEFRNVEFHYNQGQPVLRDVSFNVKRGKMVAFVGQSGMGKSTLMDLIPRFYDPTGGGIYVDGQDLRDLQNESWLRNIAIVSQDTFLFNTTIRRNILTGKPDATEAELIEAAKAAHIWHDIEKMPKGLDTPLGDRGVTLSGGQRQRVAIARAFLRKAPILLLDEATSSLDSGSEREVQKALDELIEGCTVFAVAHRLSTIRGADTILVLNEGRIIERGSHDDLMKLNGAYAGAYRLQQGEEADAEAA
ncbi:MAG: ABC transporter ATP-binding protein/permease [Planctomycetes bacterium]|nr:ABC transporter ATP-binding protein/permease [Planctomycetota bacterium]